MKYYLFAFLYLTGISLHAQEWLNPKPSGNTALDIEFTSSGKGFIINQTELLVTADLGANWVKQRDLSNATDIDFNGSKGCIVGRSGFLLTSDDSGATWQQVNIQDAGDFNSVTVVSSDTIMVSSVNKIFKSTNGAQSWQSLATPTSSITRSIFLTGKIGHIVSQDGTIFKTKDGGQTWYNTYSRNTFPSSFFSIYFVNSKVGFASLAHNDVLKTTDGGETWTEIDFSDVIYSFFFLDEKSGFAAGYDGVIFKTADGGKTWEWAGFQNGRIAQTSINGIWFTDVNTGFACGMGGRILKTTDRGKTWNFYSPSHSNITGLFLPPGNSMYAVGGKILKSTDKGTTWNVLTNDLDYDNYYYKRGYFVSEDVGYVLADGDYFGKLFKTTNGGKNWQDLTQNLNYLHNFNDIYFLDDKRGFLTGDKYGLDRYFASTTDGGSTWKILNREISFRQIWFTDALSGMGLSYGDLYQTSDGGSTWKKTYEVYGDLEQINFLTDKVGYISAEFNTVLKTIDGGKTWTELKTAYDHLNALVFKNQNTGLVAGEYGTLQYTYNGGLSWTQKQGAYGINFLALKDDYLYMAGSGGTIRREPFKMPDHDAQLFDAVNVFADKADLSGSLASNRYDINKVKFEYGTTEDLGLEIPLNTLIVTGTSALLKLTVDKLIPLTKYYYRITYSSNNISYSSEIKSFTTLTAITMQTYNVNIRDIDDVSASAYVNANVAGVNAMQFEYGVNGMFNQIVRAEPETVAAHTNILVSAALKGLLPATSYKLRLKASINGKAYYSNEVSFKTPPEYRITIYPPKYVDNKAQISASVEAFKYLVSNVIIEFGKTPAMGSKTDTGIDTVLRGSVRSINTGIAIESNTLYYFRIAARVNGKDVYTPTFPLKSDNSVLLDMLGAESITDSTAILKASLNANGMLVSSTEFEYGKTTGYGFKAGTGFGSIYYPVELKSQLTKLEPNTTYHFRLKVQVLSEYFFSDDYTFTTPHNGNNENKIVLYPNPAADKFKFEVKGNPRRLQIIGMNGSVFSTSEYTGPEIDISRLPRGLYTLKVITEDNTYTTKFIKI